MNVGRAVELYNDGTWSVSIYGEFAKVIGIPDGVFGSRAVNGS